MTKNSGRKKAARKYQQEHPGTTFPEAMRAVARPTAEAFSMPDGYLLLDQEGVPTTFDPVAYTADLNASLLTSGTSDALFPQAGDPQAPEQTEAIALRQTKRVVALVEELMKPRRAAAVEKLNEKWQRSNTATAEAQASANDLWQTRIPEELDAQAREMLQRATSAVPAEDAHGSEHRWGKSTPNPDFPSLLFRDINDNGPVSLPISLPGGAMVPESMRGLPAVAAAAAEPIPGTYRTDESTLEEQAQQSNPNSDPESGECESQNTGDDAATRKLRRIFRGDADVEVGLRRLGGIEFDETERAIVTSWDGFGSGEFADQQRSAWQAWEESRRGEHRPFLVRNDLLYLMTTQTVEDDSAE